jgi:hypothetical protein
MIIRFGLQIAESKSWAENVVYLEYPGLIAYWMKDYLVVI